MKAIALPEIKKNNFFLNDIDFLLIYSSWFHSRKLIITYDIYGVQVSGGVLVIIF